VTAAPRLEVHMCPHHYEEKAELVAQILKTFAHSEMTQPLCVFPTCLTTPKGELQHLFGQFGHITRVYLAKDRQTQRSRGFAFVNFVRKEDAKNAMEALAGYGFDHLILQIEWAQPSADK